MMCFFDKGSFDIYIFVTYFHAWDDWKKISNHSHTNQKLVLFLKRIISKQQGRRSLLFWEFRFWISNPPLQILTMLFFIIFMKGHFDRLSVCIKKIIVASLVRMLVQSSYITIEKDHFKLRTRVLKEPAAAKSKWSCTV